jgi:sulfur carrier protein
LNILLRNPRWTVEVEGARTVIGLNREAHLVIRNGTLLPGDARIDHNDTVEIRPVISGGA